MRCLNGFLSVAILVPSALAAQTPARRPAPPLTAKSVANAAYTYETDRQVTVKDSKYMYGEDADGYPLNLLVGVPAFGDLDADGDVDAVVAMNVN